MSRDLQQHRSSAAALRKTSQKISIPTDDSSDDDAYAGVDEIDSADEDEPDVEAAEEHEIRAFAEKAHTPRPVDESDEEEVWDLPSPSFFNEHVTAIEQSEIVQEPYSSSSPSDTSSPSPDRRVRFDLSEDDSDADEDEGLQDTTLWDLDSLAPHLRKYIHRPPEEDNNYSDNESFWPGESEEEVVAEDDDEEATDSVSSDSVSSGYLTDEGETTEEDIPATLHTSPRSVLRRLSDASSSSDETVNRRQVQKKVPKLSPFVLDGRKRYAMINNNGKLRMFPPRRRHSMEGQTRRPQLQQIGFEAAQMFTSPMISNSGNLMMSAMSYGQDLSLFDGQATGQPEAFFPFLSPAVPDSSSGSYHTSDDSDMELNINNFIDFGESIDGDEPEPEEESTDSPAANTPAQATRLRSEDQVHPLLHLNSDVVGQFRERHTHKNVKKRNHVSSAALAFEGPYNQAPLQGLRPGRIPHANQPMTPMPRKLKSVHGIGSSLGSPGSPLADVVGKKRKFNGREFAGHKRNRSLA